MVVARGFFLQYGMIYKFGESMMHTIGVFQILYHCIASSTELLHFGCQICNHNFDPIQNSLLVSSLETVSDN